MHAIWHASQPVHAAQSTNFAFSLTLATKRPSGLRTIRWTSLYARVVMFGWLIVELIFGPEMQEAQSRVGKTLLRRIIRPPTLASFSTSSTL